MIPPKTILVPTDFSGPANAALAYAVELAEKLDAKVHVVHTYELPMVGFPDGNLTITAEMASQIIQAADEALAVLARKYEHRKVAITTSLEQADPRLGIIEAAAKVGADLIVMGTHGRRGIARVIMGSTTEAVLRTASVPILTIREAPQTSKAPAR